MYLNKYLLNAECLLAQCKIVIFGKYRFTATLFLNTLEFLLRIAFGKKSFFFFFENLLFLHFRIKSNNLSFGKEVFLHFLPRIRLFSIRN